jgi:hypothetical protein
VLNGKFIKIEKMTNMDSIPYFSSKARFPRGLPDFFFALTFVGRGEYYDFIPRKKTRCGAGYPSTVRVGSSGSRKSR